MFAAIVNRTDDVGAWQKIPWDDPDFSRRMLEEHLSQAHDAASRRTPIIERQVAWIHRQVLKDRPSRILDLGCGPGLYSARLAALGHSCTGIDFSPASIDYAQQHGAGTYRLGDVRTVEFGADYDLVMMIFGELNAFSPEEAEQIVGKALTALKPGGRLLLEVHPYEAVQQTGQQPRTWFSAQASLYSERPHLCLRENFFKAECAVSRYYVIDAQTGETTRYVSMLRAYSESDYCHLLREFGAVEFYPSLTGDAGDGILYVILAQKR